MPNRVAICRELSWSEGQVPEWVQLLPIGPDVVGVDGRSWKLSDPEGLVRRFSTPLPFDWEHSTEIKAPKGEEAPAAGWITQLAVSRDDTGPLGPGVWGKVDWTPRGADSVRAQEYRYQSPVFGFANGEITQLFSAALTNSPNLALKALNRATEPAKETNLMNEEQRKALCTRLGLPTDSPESTVVVALNARLDNQERELSTSRARVTELETAANARELADVQSEGNALVTAAMKEGKVAPASEAAFRAMCTSRAGIEQAKTIIATLPAINAQTAPAGSPVIKSGGGSSAVTRDANGKRVLSKDEKAHCSRMNITEASYLATLEDEEEC